MKGNDETGTPGPKRTLREINDSLQGIVERMATQHVIMFGPDQREIHPNWCPLCRLEKAEEIGSPAAITAWIEATVLPMLGVKMNLAQKSIDRGALLIGCSAGDLLQAIRESEVIL